MRNVERLTELVEKGRAGLEVIDVALLSARISSKMCGAGYVGGRRACTPPSSQPGDGLELDREIPSNISRHALADPRSG